MTDDVYHTHVEMCVVQCSHTAKSRVIIYTVTHKTYPINEKLSINTGWLSDSPLLLSFFLFIAPPPTPPSTPPPSISCERLWCSIDHLRLCPNTMPSLLIFGESLSLLADFPPPPCFFLSLESPSGASFLSLLTTNFDGKTSKCPPLGWDWTGYPVVGETLVLRVLMGESSGSLERGGALKGVLLSLSSSFFNSLCLTVSSAYMTQKWQEFELCKHIHTGLDWARRYLTNT